MKPFVTYLKNQSPTPQLPSYGHGWIELPNGQRWNPAPRFNFNSPRPRCPWWHRWIKIIGGCHG